MSINSSDPVSLFSLKAHKVPYLTQSVAAFPFMTLQLVWCTLFWSPKLKDLMASEMEELCEQEAQHAVLSKKHILLTPRDLNFPKAGTKGMHHTTYSWIC